jgi:hypothetical protein
VERRTEVWLAHRWMAGAAALRVVPVEAAVVPEVAFPQLTRRPRRTV